MKTAQDSCNNAHLRRKMTHDKTNSRSSRVSTEGTCTTHMRRNLNGPIDSPLTGYQSNAGLDVCTERVKASITNSEYLSAAFCANSWLLIKSEMLDNRTTETLTHSPSTNPRFYNWRAEASQPSRSFERIIIIRPRTSCKCACAASFYWEPNISRAPRVNYSLIMLRHLYILTLARFRQRAIIGASITFKEKKAHCVSTVFIRKRDKCTYIHSFGGHKVYLRCA